MLVEHHNVPLSDIELDLGDDVLGGSCERSQFISLTYYKYITSPAMVELLTFAYHVERKIGTRPENIEFSRPKYH